MKNLILFLIGVGLALQTDAQKIKGSEVPQNVNAALAKAYPNVNNVTWEKEGDVFEASFDYQKEELSVLVDAAGKIKEVETEIEIKALPAAITNALTKDYADYKTKEAAKIVSENVTTYEAEVKKGKDSFDLIFSEDGKLLKKVATKAKKD